jgi:hypothetical protein
MATLYRAVPPPAQLSDPPSSFCLPFTRFSVTRASLPALTRTSSSADISEQHRAYWAENGGSPHPDIYFPGFEAGWHAACDALEKGEGLPDANAQGKSEDEWEWVHGFKQGALDAQKAGESN